VQAPLPQPRVRLLHELFGLLLAVSRKPKYEEWRITAKG
jgi:hypothetical protein